jgi:hypothetical protein
MDNILHYPPTTLVNRIVPKNAFYKHWDLSAKQRQHFVDDITSLTWLYKLGEETINVPAGKNVLEIDFFAVLLKNKDCPDNVFTIIDTYMPQYIVFIQCYEDECRLLLNYKEKTRDENHPFRIIKTFKGGWKKVEGMQLPLAGNTLDDVWEKFAGSISGYRTSNSETTHSIIALEALIKHKSKACEALQKKIRLERQFNRQVEMNTKARQLKKEITSLREQIETIKAEGN